MPPSLTRRTNWPNSAGATEWRGLKYSARRRGTDFDPQSSDADFLVEFRLDDGRVPLRQYLDFAEALRHTLGLPVDLVESGAVRNPYLRAAIDRSRELVYAS